MSEFYSMRDVKASRKRRCCAECGRPIEIGESYRSCSGKYEGEFWTVNVHADCQIWASAILYDGGDGRGFLSDEHPDDDLDPADLIERIRKNPPSDAVKARLPGAWGSFVEFALSGDDERDQ